jgi:hypothetical protein
LQLAKEFANRKQYCIILICYVILHMAFCCSHNGIKYLSRGYKNNYLSRKQQTNNEYI